MKAKFYIFVLVMMSIITMPIITLANHSKTAISSMPCCNKKGKNAAQKMSCCTKKNKKINDDGCGGNCNHKSCECPASCFIIAFHTNVHPFKEKIIITPKAKNIVSETIFLCKGFYSIWAPPDII